MKLMPQSSRPRAHFYRIVYAAFDFEELDFFEGTFWPFLRASESPIAMACLRLFTFPPLPPLPDLSVPLFLRRIALATVLLAPLPYLRLLDFFFAGIHSSWHLESGLRLEVVRSSRLHPPAMGLLICYGSD